MQDQDSKLQFNLLTLGLAVLLLAWGSFTLLRAQEEAAVMGQFKQTVALGVEKLNQQLAATESADSMQVLVSQKALFENLNDIQVVLWEAQRTGSKVLFLQEEASPLLAEHTMRLPLSAARPNPWMLEVIPSQAYLNSQRGVNTYLLTGLQLLLMFVLGRIALQAHRRARKSERSQDALRLEHAQLHSELEKQQAKLSAAHTRLAQECQLDPVTGIANRQRFEIELDDECRRAVREFTPLTLVRFDLTDQAYDTLQSMGEQGEALLMQLVEHLQSQLTRPGDRIARFNDASLVLLLPATNEHASTFVQRCCEAFQTLESPLNEGLHTGMVTLMPSSMLTPVYAREQLEMAMKAAWQLPVNRFHHRVEGSEHFPLTYAD